MKGREAVAEVSEASGRVERMGPFRRHRSDGVFDAELRGVLPTWLRGDLVRAAPAVFDLPRWSAHHWLDGLSLIYAFNLGDGRATYRQRLLDSVYAADAHAGFTRVRALATPVTREPLLRWGPPRQNDNANAHVLAVASELVAMTRAGAPLAINPETLAVRGARVSDDWLSWAGAVTLPHPRLDSQRGTVVNLAYALHTEEASVIPYEHPRRTHARKPFARWRTKRLPFIHSFGLTGKHVLFIDHPYWLAPGDVKGSKEGYLDLFEWAPHEGTRIVAVPRGGGPSHQHETDPLYCYSVIAASYRSRETSLDIVSHDDPSLLQGLRIESLATNGLPRIGGRLVRLIMTRGRPRAIREQLSDASIEFPTVNEARSPGTAPAYVWGMTHGAEGSALVRVDTKSGGAERVVRTGAVFSEPVFVPRPGAAAEDDGVLLAVASAATKLSTSHAALLVLDARSMEEIAVATVPVDVPLGLHGSFVPSGFRY